MQKISINSHLVPTITFLTALIAYFILAHHLPRTEFIPALFAWAIVWAATGIGAYFLREKSAIAGKEMGVMRLLFAAGLIFRLLGVFATPSLSDDYFRFIWDGRLAVAGFNPFATRPEEWLNSPLFAQLQLDDLYQNLNSPRYYSVYPPLSQLWFYAAAYLGEQEIIYELFFLRLFIIGAEIGSFFLIRKLLDLSQQPAHYAAFYWLNPLIIIELTYNLHFEAVQIFFLLLTLYALQTQRVKMAALSLALAAAAKLLPLIFAPILWFRLGLKRGFWFLSASGLFFLVSFLPFFDLELIAKIGSSVGLYFNSFEFNASIYYLAREVGFWVYGNNQIAFLGKTLSILSLIIILFISKKAADKRVNLAELMLFTLTGYYLFATTIHPWYLSNLLVLGVLSGYKYPLVWSFMVFLTYKSYENADLYQESLYLVALEYLLVGIYFYYEKAHFFRKKG